MSMACSTHKTASRRARPSKPREPRVYCLSADYSERCVVKGQPTYKREPLFRRYLFIYFDQWPNPWHVIRNTFGVSELVRFGDKLATIDDTVIESMKSIDLPVTSLFEPGGILTLAAGLFKDLEVVFQMRDGDQRTMVLIELINKTHQLSLELHNLKKTT